MYLITNYPLKILFYPYDLHLTDTQSCPKDLGPVYSKARRMPASFCLVLDPCSLSMMPSHWSLDLKGMANTKEEYDTKHLRGMVNKTDRHF